MERSSLEVDVELNDNAVSTRRQHWNVSVELGGYRLRNMSGTVE